MTSILAERLLIAATGLEVRYRESAGLVHDYSGRRDVDEPAVAGWNHISVTDPDDYPNNDAHWRSVEDIGRRRFGTGRFDPGISYNGGVLPGAVLYEGQPWGRRGAHTVNTYEIGECDTPGCPGRGTSVRAPSWNNNVNGRALVFARNIDDPITDADVDAAGRYWAAYKIVGLLRRDARLHGHWCVTAKGCPGRRVWDRIDDIADATATYYRTGLPDNDQEVAMPGPAMLIAKGRSVIVAVLVDGRVLSLTATGGELLSDAYDVPIVSGMPLVDIQLIQSGVSAPSGAQLAAEDAAAALEPLEQPGPIGGVPPQHLESESDSSLGIDGPSNDAGIDRDQPTALEDGRL